LRWPYQATVMNTLLTTSITMGAHPVEIRLTGPMEAGPLLRG
ncbi:MAG: hypothetical protein RJB04_803, partial [Verrucomicrobiota bacterium]